MTELQQPTPAVTQTNNTLSVTVSVQNKLQLFWHYKPFGHDKEVCVTLIGLALVIGNTRPTHPRETWGHRWGMMEVFACNNCPPPYNWSILWH